jgi:localization factor PodJL
MPEEGAGGATAGSFMKPGIPWSVKGIGEDAREAAKLAARRAGMTLGEWLNTVILEQAESPPFNEALRPVSAPTPQREDASLKLENLAQELARLSRRDQETAAARYIDQAPIADFERRLAANERQTMDALASINERFSALQTQVATTPQMRLPERPEDVPGYLALENALRNVVDHIENSEKRTREALRGMQERVGDMAQRALQSGSEHILQNAPAISRIENRLADLSARLDLAESMAARDLPGLVEGELSKLERRIEDVKQASETAAHRAQTAATTAAQREMRELDSRMQAMFRDAQSTMRGAASGDLQRVKAEIESLNQRIDDLKADAASERDVHQLRVAIEQLSARIAQGPDLRPLADMDRRLADLAQRLEQGALTAHIPRLDELEARIGEIDIRLAETQRDGGGDSRAFEALQQQIAGLSDRLGQTEQHLGHLATLERSIQQLYESVEQSRNWTQQIAEDAASRMADRVMQSLPQTAWQAAPSNDLKALEEGLAAVRASAAQADQRTQETLEAVHDTLEQVVSKLADLEAADRSAFTAPPAAPQPMQFAPAPEPPQQTWPNIPNFDGQPPNQVWHDPAAYAPQPEPQPAAYMPPLPETPPVYSAPIPDQMPPVADAGGGFERDDFIAAARRAAQAAAAQQSVTPAVGANRGVQNGGLSLPKLELPFLKGRAKTKLDMPVSGPMAGLPKPTSNATRRRQWILVGIALLSVASVVSANYLFGGGSKPAPDPAKLQSAPATPEVTAPEAPAPTTEVTPEAQPSAKPPKPRPAELESGMPSPDTLQQPGATTAYVGDGVLTGALPAGKADPSITSLVADVAAQPGETASNELPPAELGSESLRKAAAAGDAKAQFIVASRYLDGKQTAQNFVESARWYQKSAAQGLAPAQYRLATLFERGRGVTQDATMARVWYERSAAQGNVKAMHNTAVIYSGAQGGTPDYDKAVQWFAAAAKHGLKDSQYNLAVLYERGLGITADPGEAAFWYSLAGQQNDKDAMAKAGKILPTLPAETAKAIKARLAAWKAAPSVEEANVVAISDPSWQPGAGKMGLAEGFSLEGAALGSKDLVSEVQSLLGDLGYSVGKPDGKMGSRTANAIRLFQMKAGLKVTGQITPELAAKLREAAG